MAQPNDTSEAQREIETLQRVVARTSDNMVDVFDTAPHKPPINPYGHAADQAARQTWYQALLSKLGNEDDSASEDEEDGPEMRRERPQVKTDPNEALVGTFREAAAAMA